MNAGQELVAHLIRLAAASLVWLVVAAFLWRRPGPAWRGFALMTVAWAVIDLVIVGASWSGAAASEPGKLKWFLWFNEGLNLVYIAAGAATILRTTKEWWKGAGLAILLQGLTLLALDTWLLLRLA